MLRCPGGLGVKRLGFRIRRFGLSQRVQIRQGGLVYTNVLRGIDLRETRPEVGRDRWARRRLMVDEADGRARMVKRCRIRGVADADGPAVRPYLFWSKLF